MAEDARTPELQRVVVVGTTWSTDLGKTTLTAAILRVQARNGLAEYQSYDRVAKGGITRDKNRAVAVITSHGQYEADRRHEAHVDCPSGLSGSNGLVLAWGIVV